MGSSSVLWAETRTIDCGYWPVQYVDSQQKGMHLSKAVGNATIDVYVDFGVFTDARISDDAGAKVESRYLVSDQQRKLNLVWYKPSGIIHLECISQTVPPR